MSEFEKLELPQVEGLNVKLDGPNAVSLAGVLSTPDPRQTVGSFFEALHRAAVADGVSSVEVNVRELTFVNSSAIRLFVDWASRITSAPEAERYQVHFLTSRQITWQRTSFNVLRSLAPEAVQITSE
jgi:hypothetical protein